MDNAFPESERSIVGIILHTSDGIYPVLADARLGADDFTDTLALPAWKVMAALRTAGTPIDMITVSEGMVKAGVDRDEAETFLAKCMDNAPTAAHAEYHARRLKAATLNRRAWIAIGAANEAAVKGGQELPSIIGTLRAELDDIEADQAGEPQIVSARDFTATPLHEPPQVIHGVIRAGQVGLMAASSKAGKSWALLHLGMAVPTGRDWLGWQTTKGRVLYVNAELPPYDLQRRMERLYDALGLGGIPDGLDVWHLRGTSMTIRQLIPVVLRRQKKVGPYALILPDPLYAFGGGRDENSNSEQAKTMAELSELAERSGAAVWIAHHFSKGNKAMTDHLDRASGAGMYARAVDVFATFTRHEEEECYSVETTCRSFQRPEPFVVRWEYPLWRIAADLDPNDLKQQPKQGRPPRFTPGSIAELIPDAGMKYSELQKLAESSLGVKESRFAQLLKLAKAGGLVRQDFGMYFRVGVGP